MTATHVRAATLAFVWLLVGLAPSARAQESHAEHPQHTAPSASQAASESAPQAVQDERPAVLPPFVPPLTDDDRRAAFPDVHGHAVHDKDVNYFVLFDQLEWQAGGQSQGPVLNSRGWIGRDLDRLWFRAEGDAEGGQVGEADTHLMYGRRFSRWWDAVAGVRQDFRPGAPQTWAAFGIQGLAPYWFDVEATGYVGASGRTKARLEVEYELLFTNRLVLQPRLEAEIVGRSDPERGVGAGLSTTDLGFRLRYEVRREVAPYVGLTWHNTWGRTADFAAAAGEERGGARFVTGLRVWF
ncbi:MAG: copper resistance protein B [Acidobacteriota bacterium]